MLGAHSATPLRGDYSRAGPDYTVDQDLAQYSATDHAVWQQLVTRQTKIIKRHACTEFLQGVATMQAPQDIPRLDQFSDFIFQRTGWRLVAVPGFIPDASFFSHLAARRFPVSVWVRRPEEMDYLVEPDLFHDFFGHVPMLLDPVFADYLAAYGAKGLTAADGPGLGRLGRLYWYTVEFGLIDTDAGLKAYGAGMLSSKAETVYSITSPKPHRVWFDLRRVMRSEYRIDDFQKTYFVLPDFATLFAAMDRDFDALYADLEQEPDIDPGTLVPGDRLYAARHHA
ncbi:MAG: phenylalanine 4-monooxygenase [Rhodocyclaceae bacterium]|nr:phenylalanine 4-monooxygenase [Rhodocyclaceae bacterium]